MPEPESNLSPDGEESPERTSRERLWAAFLSPTRGQIVVGVLVGLLAFGALTQVRINERSDVYGGMRTADLVQTLNGLSAAQRRAEAEIARLEKSQKSLQSNSDKRSAALEQTQGELATLSILAGTRAAVGPGVVVGVTEGRSPLGLNHLLDGIQELRDAGAEAIEINDSVRVVAQTSFEETSGGLLADGRKLAPPYTIKAIGDPETLDKALAFVGGFIDDVRFNTEGDVKVRKREKVRITVTRRPTQSEFSQPKQ